ncbi:hypothetical protein M0812_29601 [Anaeramoeba flamelloides]|uniref:PH domain-containing protein n=1 Tax=Anaeramoeba flamelloides TaxID=1746091 RepID=A0AAV7Y737_9EUKA|nr:hypothetical protein M0812_29601 [Anaeramoeba flamelloides]
MTNQIDLPDELPPLENENENENEQEKEEIPEELKGLEVKNEQDKQLLNQLSSFKTNFDDQETEEKIPKSPPKTTKKQEEELDEEDPRAIEQSIRKRWEAIDREVERGCELAEWLSKRSGARFVLLGDELKYYKVRFKVACKHPLRNYVTYDPRQAYRYKDAQVEEKVDPKGTIFLKEVTRIYQSDEELKKDYTLGIVATNHKKKRKKERIWYLLFSDKREFDQWCFTFVKKGISVEQLKKKKKKKNISTSTRAKRRPKRRKRNKLLI